MKNAYGFSVKLLWLEELEGLIQSELFSLYEADAPESQEAQSAEEKRLPAVDAVAGTVADAETSEKVPEVDSGEEPGDAPDAGTSEEMPEETPEELPKEPLDEEQETEDDAFSAASELRVPFPYDSLYTEYLIAHIYMHNEDYEQYSNAMSRFNARYASFADHYNRTHMPKQNNTVRV